MPEHDSTVRKAVNASYRLAGGAKWLGVSAALRTLWLALQVAVGGLLSFTWAAIVCLLLWLLMSRAYDTTYALDFTHHTLGLSLSEFTSASGAHIARQTPAGSDVSTGLGATQQGPAVHVLPSPTAEPPWIVGGIDVGSAAFHGSSSWSIFHPASSASPTLHQGTSHLPTAWVDLTAHPATGGQPGVGMGMGMGMGMGGGMGLGMAPQPSLWPKALKRRTRYTLHVQLALPDTWSNRLASPFVVHTDVIGWRSQGEKGGEGEGEGEGQWYVMARCSKSTGLPPTSFLYDATVYALRLPFSLLGLVSPVRLRTVTMTCFEGAAWDKGSSKGQGQVSGPPLLIRVTMSSTQAHAEAGDPSSASPLRQGSYLTLQPHVGGVTSILQAHPLIAGAILTGILGVCAFVFLCCSVSAARLKYGYRMGVGLPFPAFLLHLTGSGAQAQDKEQGGPQQWDGLPRGQQMGGYQPAAYHQPVSAWLEGTIDDLAPAHPLRLAHGMQQGESRHEQEDDAPGLGMQIPGRQGHAAGAAALSAAQDTAESLDPAPSHSPAAGHLDAVELAHAQPAPEHGQAQAQGEEQDQSSAAAAADAVLSMLRRRR